MIGSVHLADIDVRARWTALTGARPTAGAGYASTVLAAGLRGSSLITPDLGRVGLIAFWDSEFALDGFLANHPLAALLAPGWHLRLAPTRASGHWPGLPEDLPTSHDATEDGPAAVLTLGRLRLSQLVRFRKASGSAEARLSSAEGLIWATGLARPPLVATFSLWRSAAVLSAYAYDGAHANVIRADRARPFHRQSAFIRFRPYSSAGQLDGRNPLPANWAAPLTSADPRPE